MFTFIEANIQNIQSIILVMNMICASINVHKGLYGYATFNTLVVFLLLSTLGG